MKSTNKKLFLSILLLINGPLIFSQTIGNWNSSAISTYTTSAIGVGTSTPQAWEEIEYCSNTEKGLIVTKQNCGATFGGFLGGHLADELTTLPPLLIAGSPEFNVHIPISFAYSALLTNPSIPFSFGTLSMSPLYQNQQPLFVARVKETLLPGSPIGTRFIVTPDGRVGINLPSPRSALDIRGNYDVNVPLAIFGINTTTNYSKHIHFTANTGNGGYNNISQNGDLAMFFTDGLNNLGSNSNGAFIIAPWSTANGVGGLRMESNGNTELRGNLRCSKVTVNAPWWPDFVFQSNYKLMDLDSLSTFININSCLPGFPIQDSIVRNGQDIGDLQKLQQLKIEELTLYILIQNEKAKSQSKILEDFIFRIEELEKKLNLTK